MVVVGKVESLGWQMYISRADAWCGMHVMFPEGRRATRTEKYKGAPGGVGGDSKGIVGKLWFITGRATWHRMAQGRRERGLASL